MREPEDVSQWTDKALLQELIGARAARRAYQGSLQPLFARTSNEHVSAKLTVARELIQRWLREELKRQPVFTQPNVVRDFLKLHFANREHEAFLVLFLDAQNRLIRFEELFRGTLTQTSVYPREVVKAALKSNAAALILAHNHPSGVAEPSTPDHALTRTLTEALALVDVKVLDHFIVAGSNSFSFMQHGLL